MAKGMDGRTFAGLGISHEVARLTRSREMTHQSCDSIMGRASLLVLFSPSLSGLLDMSFPFWWVPHSIESHLLSASSIMAWIPRR